MVDSFDLEVGIQEVNGTHYIHRLKSWGLFSCDKNHKCDSVTLGVFCL